MKKILLTLTIFAISLGLSAQQIFPGTAGASEGTNVIYWSNNPVCNSGASRAISITAAYTALTDSAADQYQIFGSNCIGPHNDSVPIQDENGVKVLRLLTNAYIRPNFPFKYIGIYYKKGGGTVTGTYTFYITESSYSTTLQ